MQTKYDVKDRVLVEGEVREIEIDNSSTVYYEVVIINANGSREYITLKESQLKTCLAVEK